MKSPSDTPSARVTQNYGLADAYISGFARYTETAEAAITKIKSAKPEAIPAIITTKSISDILGSLSPIGINDLKGNIKELIDELWGDVAKFDPFFKSKNDHRNALIRLAAALDDFTGHSHIGKIRNRIENYIEIAGMTFDRIFEIGLGMTEGSPIVSDERIGNLWDNLIETIEAARESDQNGRIFDMMRSELSRLKQQQSEQISDMKDDIVDHDKRLSEFEDSLKKQKNMQIDKALKLIEKKYLTEQKRIKQSAEKIAEEILSRGNESGKGYNAGEDPKKANLSFARTIRRKVENGGIGVFVNEKGAGRRKKNVQEEADRERARREAVPPAPAAKNEVSPHPRPR